jgi:hypothetical protein
MTQKNSPEEAVRDIRRKTTTISRPCLKSPEIAL